MTTKKITPFKLKTANDGNLPVSRQVSISQYRHLMITLKSRLNAAQRARAANDNNECDYHLGLAVKMIVEEINLNGD